MVFSSPWFVLFLIGTLCLLALPVGISPKKRILGLLSCLFYAAWDYRYVALLLMISAIDFVCARCIHRETSARTRRTWLIISLSSNLGLLCYFKYTNFFIATLNGLLPRMGWHLPVVEILLPAGISFYTFKTMSYVIDVYRGEIEPVGSVLDYAMFVTFFPELIAGPIVRASVFLPQMGRMIGPTKERLTLGGSAFLLGFSKKVLADRLGILVSPIFANPHLYDVPTLWSAALAYALQIYCDFSGYSDMAIGTAKMIGYDLPENFNLPYLSGDVAEFWRRWHITLSSWLRDYLYIPLGGNRRGTARTYVNLLATMLLGGLWHGASWSFVLWGGLHGGALALHRFYRDRVPKTFVISDFVAVPFTFLFVAVCWIPFRCATFTATGRYLLGLVGQGHGSIRWMTPDLIVIVVLVALGHIAGPSLFGSGERSARIGRLFERCRFAIAESPITGPYLQLGTQTFLGAYLTMTWALLAFLFFLRANAPFLYFQF